MDTYTADGRLKLDTGAGGSGGISLPINADDVNIADSGGLYAATDVEAALAEVATDVAGITSGDPWTVITKSADEDVASSTTEQSDDELLFPIAATQIILFEMFVFYSNAAGSAPDFKFRIIGPAGVFGTYHVRGQTTTDAAQHAIGAIGTAPAAVTLGTSTVVRVAQIDGSAVTGGTSGNITFQWCQNSSNVTPTRVHSGSILRYRVIR